MSVSLEEFSSIGRARREVKIVEARASYLSEVIYKLAPVIDHAVKKPSIT